MKMQSVVITKLATRQANRGSTDCTEIKDKLLTDITDEGLSSDDISDCFYQTEGIFSVKESKPTNKVNIKFPNNKWFDEEYKQAKTIINEYAKHNDISQPPSSGRYLTFKCEYNRVKQKHKRQHNDNVRQKLQSFHSKEPASYWKLWKSLNPPQVNNSTLSLHDFNKYCQDQVNPPPLDILMISIWQRLRHLLIPLMTALMMVIVNLGFIQT